MEAVSGKTRIYNVCTNTKISVNELVETFNKEHGREIMPVYAPLRPGDIHTSYMSYDKIKNELG